MDAVLREISALCAPTVSPDIPPDVEAALPAPPLLPSVTLKDGTGGTIKVQPVKLTPAVKKVRKARK
jgi:hypothetical protein